MKVGDTAYFNLLNNRYLYGKILEIRDQTILIELLSEEYKMKHIAEIPLTSILFIVYPPNYKGEQVEKN